MYNSLTNILVCLLDEDYETNIEVASREYTLKTFNDFKKTLEGMKYNTETILFKIDLWRAEW